MGGADRETFARIARSAGLRVARLVAARLESNGARRPGAKPDIYESLYEAHAREQEDNTVVGDLSLAPIEHEIVQEHGLKPDQTLVDLGCGIGRLACEVVPWLESGGAYIGTDVSETMLKRAERRLAEVIPSPACSVRWIKQVGRTFPLEADSVDMVCAFSVFTHIEHEDAYAFLCDARRVVRPSGRFVFSCLPMDMSDSRFFFHISAQMDVTERWKSVRNVATSIDMMDWISAMAGWEPETWVTGNRERFGQAVCVLKPLPHETMASRPNPWEF